MTYGIDIGSSQQGLNPADAQNSGFQFAIIKAGGYNVTPMYVAPYYHLEVDKCRIVGMSYGHYWMVGNTATQSPSAQADYFTSHLYQFDKNSQVLALDNENIDSNGQLWTDAKVAEWVNRVIANTGIDPRRIWIYMSVANIRASSWAQTLATGCRWWVAAWGNNDGVRVTPDLGGKIPAWHVQQYCSSQAIGRIVTDMNFSPLSMADLFNIGAPAPDPTPEPQPVAVDPSYGDDQQMLYDGSTSAFVAPFGSNPTEVCVYRGGQWIVFWGNNANVPPPPPPPPPPGIARFAGNGSVTTASTPPKPKPVASFTYAQTTGTYSVSFTNTSTAQGNSITASAWDFGDGSTATSTNATHTYAAKAATYTVTLTVTDSYSQTATTTKSVTLVPPPPPPPPPPSNTKYAIGNMYDGWNAGETIQQNVTAAGGKVYTFADLGLTASTTNLQTIVDKLPGPGVIQLPANWTGYIPNFAHHGTNDGIYNANLMGLLGNIANGEITTVIKVASNAETATQAWSLGNKDATGAARAAKLGDTTAIAAYRLANTKPHFLSGIRFQGSDQIKATDTSNNRTGPAVWGGLALNKVGGHALLQNLHLQGFGRADDWTPPGEVGNFSETHSQYLKFRRIEHDGRIPFTTGSTDPYGMGWRRGGGIQWNQAAFFECEDVYTHDTWASGWTASFTGVPADHTHMSHDYSTRRMTVAHNSHHGTAAGNQNSGTFPSINMEFNYGTIHHYQPHFGIVDGGLAANHGHIHLWMKGTIAGTAYLGDPALNLIVHQPVWENSSALYNGNFVITYIGLKTIGGKYPTVYLTSDETKPATPYVVAQGTQVPSNITAANNYYVLAYS